MLLDSVTGRITKAQFIDRIFAHQHNGGCFLNKVSWGTTNRRKWAYTYLQDTVLPAHGQDNWRLLYSIASPEVQRLFDDHWAAMNKVRVRIRHGAVLCPTRGSQTRTLCRLCHSNPVHGHYSNCTGYKRYSMEIETDQPGHWLWDKWLATKDHWEVKFDEDTGETYIRVLPGSQLTFELYFIHEHNYRLPRRQRRRPISGREFFLMTGPREVPDNATKIQLDVHFGRYMNRITVPAMPNMPFKFVINQSDWDWEPVFADNLKGVTA